MPAFKKTQLKIAIVANTSWYLYNFRRNLIKVLQLEGHCVVAIAPRDDYSKRLADESIPYRHFPLDGSSTNPLRELNSIVALRRILQDEQVDVVFSYTPKGNIYSGISVLGRSTRLIANVSGLGRAFVQRTWLTLLARLLYRRAFKNAAWVFFQNEEDCQIFTEAGLVNIEKTVRIPGSGVDLTYFCPDGNPVESEAPTFLLIARLLWDKGVGDFVEAARLVLASYPTARFQLLGFVAVANPSAVPKSVVDAWVEEGVIEYLGTTDDVRPYLRAADCCVLPSFYREGVPRSLLEAASMAIPVITTDAIGCRDTVDDGVSGFLCLPRNAKDLAEKMLKFTRMSKVERKEMGARGRDKMVREFDERIVIARYLDAIGE
jgi:glycosyltransferase involved in cell wall biosynthesis